MLRSIVETVSAPSDKDISWLNPRPHSPAVYASCATLPSPHATLATGRLARPYPGRTCTSRSNQLYVGAFLYPSYPLSAHKVSTAPPSPLPFGDIDSTTR